MPTSPPTLVKVVVTCLSITKAGKSYVADCQFKSADGPVVFCNDEPTYPHHLIKVRKRCTTAVEFEFSMDPQLPPGCTSITIDQVVIPSGSELHGVAKNMLYDKDDKTNTVWSFYLLLLVTGTDGKTYPALWDPGVDNDGPP